MIILLWGSVAVAILIPLSAAVYLWVRYAPTVARGLADMPWLPTNPDAAMPEDWRETLAKSEEVTFVTADGLRLSGSYLEAEGGGRRGVVIFCHELYGNRRSGLAFAGNLRQSGFDILTFDFRNHGASESQEGYEPVPWATRGEMADVRAAVDFCCRRHAAMAGQVVLFGLSRGATAALCVASKDPRVKVAVLDSMCPTERVHIYLIRRFMAVYSRSAPVLSKLPDWLLSILAFWAKLIIQRRHGCRLANVERLARRIRKPLFLIHGERDVFIPATIVRALRDRMPNCPRLWIVPGAKHNQTVCEAGDGYGRRVARFLVQHMESRSGAIDPVRKPASTDPALADSGHPDGAPLPC